MTSTTAQDARVRQTIRDAMERLLAGTALHSDGKLTVKSLAEEARVKRWLLTHRHTDLQDEFRARVAQLGRVPRSVQVLLEERDNLRERLAKLAEELRSERETVKRLERVVNVLALQLEQERAQDEARTNVRPLRRDR